MTEMSQREKSSNPFNCARGSNKYQTCAFFSMRCSILLVCACL